MYEEILEKMLGTNRIYHSYCVADQAKKLAIAHGVDENKAGIAGLLHDITKEVQKEKHLQIIKDAGIILDTIQKSTTKLLHSISGSVYIKKYLNIDDEEIIDAIRYHTTAKPNMSKLTKIIYLADYTSIDRDFSHLPCMQNLISYLKNLVLKSLDESIKFIMPYSIKSLLDKSSYIHPDSFSAYNYYIKI